MSAHTLEARLDTLEISVFKTHLDPEVFGTMSYSPESNPVHIYSNGESQLGFAVGVYL